VTAECSKLNRHVQMKVAAFKSY